MCLYSCRVSRKSNQEPRCDYVTYTRPYLQMGNVRDEAHIESYTDIGTERSQLTRHTGTLPRHVVDLEVMGT